jgi:hypothetical protein
MSKQEDWWPSGRAALLVVLGLATGAVVQRSPGAPARPSSAAAAAATTETAHATGLSAAEHVIELLADSVGADLENLEARDAAVAWRDYLCLKLPRTPDDTQARMLSALDAVAIRLGGRPHADIHPTDAPLNALQLTDALSVIRAHAAFEGGDPEIKKRRAVVTQYFETSGPKNSIDTIARKAADRQMNVRMLIAMLPDYVDSQTRRLFDSGLAGIQQAAGTLGYTLDRFHLPGWSAHEHPGARPPSAHDSEPGALLFRSSRSDEHELLLVLIVTEMPTLGVHRNAMSSSIALIDAWAEASNGGLDTLRILGPFFSGSVASLKDIFESLENESYGEPRTVQIVTGTATDPSIGQQLRSVRAQGVHVSFQAIVPNNDQVRATLLNRLEELNPRWKCGNAIALLVEGNTKFGQSLLIRKSDSREASETTRSNSDDECLPPLEVTFPLHISRLRATVDAETPAVSLLTPPAVKLKLTESSQPMDVVPSMTPDVTASVVDSAVDNLLAALHRERYSAIGIFATDARDHLFLARRIAKAVPDVLMFGTQADLLYVNREYAPFLRGTLIASSYPVFSQTQLMADATNDALRRQFTTASEQGAYNATLTLLADRHTAAVTLIDGTFGPPCSEQACAPRVWLSVVGSNAMWPIDSSVNLDDQLPTEKAATSSTSNDQQPQTRMPRPITAAPPSIVAAAMMVFAVALVHLLGLVFTLTAPKHAARPNPHRTHHVRNTQDIAEAAKDLAAMCHWQNSRVLWNFYPPSDVARPRTPAPADTERATR